MKLSRSLIRICSLLYSGTFPPVLQQYYKLKAKDSRVILNINIIGRKSPVIWDFRVLVNTFHYQLTVVDLGSRMSDTMEEGRIGKFYENKTVFVTGATGFMGKVLVEKLLRSTKVKKIYLLIRTKEGHHGSEKQIMSIFGMSP